MTPYQSLADLFAARARRLPADVAYRFHRPAPEPPADLVMHDLDLRVRAIAAGLQGMGLSGGRAILALPHSSDFIVAFWACVMAGVVAVPVPHQRAGRKDGRFNAVIRDAAPELVVADEAARAWVGEIAAAEAAAAGRPAPVVTTISGLSGEAGSWLRPDLDRDSLAVLQYTSGSTGDPKGVMISHGNILANCRLIESTLKFSSASSGVLWLPFFHDMGLVGSVLSPMYTMGRVDLMSPQDFMRAPLSWLERLSSVRATTTASPNFALELCCDMATPEKIAALDLSALDCMLIGSEPVNANTIERFAEVFRPCGFRYDAFLPAYGLAENTLIASGTLKPGRGPAVVSLDEKAIAAGRVEIVAAREAATRFVGNGAPCEDLRIVDPETGLAVGEGMIGEIWLTGASLAKGYWARPELSAEAFGARIASEPDGKSYYKTGDLGFVLADDLYVTGRSKDLIIVRGRNIYPQDIEDQATRDQPLLWTGAAAAFAIDRGHGEDVVIVAEAGLSSIHALRESDTANRTVADILKALSESHEIVPAEICIVKPGRIPRTSSGKIRRSSTRQEWLEDGLASGLIHRWVRPEIHRQQEEGRPSGEMLTRAEIEDWLIERLARHSGQPKHMIDLDEPFASFGLDSMTAVEMIEAVNRLGFEGRRVDPVDLYDYPTVTRLLDHIFDRTTAKAAPPAETAAPDDALAREAAALRALLDE